jgi:hypothetical protein
MSLFYFKQKTKKRKKKTPRSEYENEYRLSDRSLSAKLVPTFADKGCHMVSVMDPYGRILIFLDRSTYLFFQVAPQLKDRLCELVVGDADYRSRGPGSIPGATRFSEK